MLADHRDYLSYCPGETVTHVVQDITFCGLDCGLRNIDSARPCPRNSL
jgi:hypothetical protein